jgi:two-component system NarL family sensor kinase
MPDRYTEIYTQFIAITLIIGFLIVFVVLLTLLYQKRKMQQKKELQLLKMEMDKEMLSTRVEIQENVQREISMEIHDNVGQTLLLTNVNLTILVNQIGKDPAVLQLVQECRELLKKSMEDLTFLSRSMNPDRIVEIGVFNAIVHELENLERKNIVNSAIEIDQSIIMDMELKPEIQLLLFRVYQEAIKNILKYADATLVKFELHRKENGIEMSIKDDGKGFDQQQDGIKHGIGFSNMQKRATFFNGSFQVTSEPGKGTLVQVFIPADQLSFK